jgi:site-specific DNA recombinase
MTLSTLRHGASNKLRAALYARFSSDIQNELSVERQFADLEKAAVRLGLKLDKRHYYSDRAKSASSLLDRPGLTRELLGASQKNQFDVVLVEATDRLSRNKADLFFLADHFKYNGTKIFTPAGEVSELQLTFDGHQNADFLAKLALRIKSGHDQIARKGLIPGRAAYGYDCVDHYMPGETAGVKVINREQAKIVVRIFREYASGKSPRQIAADLTRDKIPSPSGKGAWNFQRIVGGEGRTRGLIHNQLYLGIYLKNRFFNIKKPGERGVITRKADPSELIRVEVPHLRIVDQALWDAAHAVRKQRGHKKFGSGQIERATVIRRPHLLQNLLRCADCGGAMIRTSTDRNGLTRVACKLGFKGQCKHGKTYNLDKLTTLAVNSMRSHLTDQEVLKEHAKAKMLERTRLEKQNRSERLEVQKLFDRTSIQLKKLVRAMDDDEGDEIPKSVMDLIRAKEIELKHLAERLKPLEADNVTVLQPHALLAFGKSIETLHARLEIDRHDPECRMAFANLIGSVVVHPTGFGQPYDISLYARLSAMGSDFEVFPKSRSTQEIIAAEGFPRTSRRISTGAHETS